MPVMINWISILKEGTLKWPTEETNPSVQYLALRAILEKKEASPDF